MTLHSSKALCLACCIFTAKKVAFSKCKCWAVHFREALGPTCPFCVTSDVCLPPPGATATRWAPPAGSATSGRGSVSASQASPASTVTHVRATTSALALKAANVSLRGQSKADGKDVAHPALPLLSFCLWEGILSPCSSSQQKLALFCPHCA